MQAGVDAVLLDDLQALIEHPEQGIAFPDRQAIARALDFPADDLQLALPPHALRQVFPGQTVAQHGVDLAIQKALHRLLLVGCQH